MEFPFKLKLQLFLYIEYSPPMLKRNYISVLKGGAKALSHGLSLPRACALLSLSLSLSLSLTLSCYLLNKMELQH